MSSGAPLGGKEERETPGVPVYPEDWLVAVHRQQRRSSKRSRQFIQGPWSRNWPRIREDRA